MNNHHAVYYSKEEVALSYWVLSTQNILDHGLPTLLWAMHIRIWIVNVVSYVKRKFNKSFEFESNFILTIKKIRRGELNFKDTP